MFTFVYTGFYCYQVHINQTEILVLRIEFYFYFFRYRSHFCSISFLFFGRYLIYTVAKPKRNGKPQEEVAKDDNSDGNSPLYNILREILDQSGLEDLIINSRIIKNIDTQIIKVLNLGKKAMKSGGKYFKALVRKWQSGKTIINLKFTFTKQTRSK